MLHVTSLLFKLLYLTSFYYYTVNSKTIKCMCQASRKKVCFRRNVIAWVVEFAKCLMIIQRNQLVLNPRISGQLSNYTYGIITGNHEFLSRNGLLLNIILTLIANISK